MKVKEMIKHLYEFNPEQECEIQFMIYNETHSKCYTRPSIDRDISFIKDDEKVIIDLWESDISN